MSFPYPYRLMFAGPYGLSTKMLRTEAARGQPVTRVSFFGGCAWASSMVAQSLHSIESPIAVGSNAGHPGPVSQERQIESLSRSDELADQGRSSNISPMVST